MIESAIAKRFTHFYLSEHMPRLDRRDMYPEESDITPADLSATFAQYIVEARRLQAKYGDKIDILVGFEGEYIRSEEYEKLLHSTLDNTNFDFWIGSIHYVNSIPIDYDADTWNKAADSVGGIDALMTDYFSMTEKMIDRMEPPIIGHLDRIRVFHPNPQLPIKTAYPTAYRAVERAIERAIEYGALFELNSSAFKKGLTEPYPHADLVQLIKQKNGKFCLSDDSHSPSQVGQHYEKLLDFIKRMEIDTLYVLKLVDGKTVTKPIPFSQISSWKP